MRIAKLTVLAAFGLCFLAGPVRAADSIVGVEAKLWNPEIGAKFKSSTSLLDGTNIDLDQDLDLATAKKVPYVKLWVGGSQRLVGSATRVDTKGKTTLDEDITFDGHTYSVGEKVESEMDISIYRVAWEADWFSGGWGKLGTILGADYFDVKTSVKSETTGIKEEDRVKGPVPIVGLQGEISLLAGLSLYGEGAGLYVKTGDFEGSLLEAEGGLKYDLFGHASISLGWRQINIRAEDKDNNVKLTLGGAIVGLGVRF